MTVIERFLKYVSFDTQSDENSGATPSTPKQMVFAQYLRSELEQLGFQEISLDENGYLFATWPANTDKPVPTIGFIAHMDTSPDMTGAGVTPRIVYGYDGTDIVEGLETGADKYLIKPFNIGILKASIANILTNRALLRSKYAEMELHNDSISINYSNTLDQQFLEAVKETITENLDNSGFNVESLCASQNMSRSSFYNKLKALTDQAPADYIRLIRLKRAAQLLSEGQYNISEISDMTGFNDVKYFREVFKKYYKISPSGYSKGEMKEEPTKT